MARRTVALIALLTSACVESKSELGVRNTPPDAAISEPSSTGVYYEGTDIRFAGVVTDTETAAQELYVDWSTDELGSLGLTSVVDSDGSVEVYGALPEGDHTVRLTVIDGGGEEASVSQRITVLPPNQDPTCAFTAPEDGSSAGVGDEVRFEADVSDPDGDDGDLSVALESDRDGSLTDGSIRVADGSMTASVSDLSAGTHVISLLVDDPFGGSCISQRTLNVGNAPELELTAPESGAVVGEGEALTISGTVSDVEDDPRDLSITIVSDADGAVGEPSADSDGDFSASLDSLSLGEHTLTITATDTDGFDSDEEVTITINALPTQPTVSISPDPAGTSNDLTANVSGSYDPDSSVDVAFSYDWLDNGSSLGVSTAILNAAATQKGHTYTVVVTPSDGTSDGPAGEASILISNTDPVLTDVSVTPTTGAVGDILTCAATATDADGDALSTDYAWSTGATGATYTIQSTDDPGDTLTCTATVTDTDGGTATGTATATVTNTDPVVIATSVSPSSGAVGDTLTCTASATDADGDTPTLAYAWTNGSTTVGSSTAYTIQTTDDPGDTLTCTATATDTFGGSGTGTATASVTNTDPVLTGATVSPSTAVVGDTLTCSATATDADGGTPSLSYAWSNGATGATTVVSSTDAVGSSLTCTITASDTDGGTDTDSAAATILNTAPTVASVSVSPTTARVGESLTCSATGADANSADTLTTTYAWSTGATGASYTVQSTDDPGDTLTCTATVTDNHGDAATGTANATVTNTDPVVIATSVSPSSGAVGDTLTCTASATDADGDTPTLAYAWTNGSTTIGSSAAYTIQTTDDPGDTLTCTATAADTFGGTGTGTATASVTNTEPVMGTVSISPSSATNDDTLTCSASATDADGGTPTLSYVWTDSSGGILSTVGTVDLSLTTVSSLELVTCTATAADTDGGSDTGTASLTTSNRDPSATAAVTPSSGATRLSTLSCSGSGTDLDGDTTTLSFAWDVGGTTVSATSGTATTSTLEGAFSAGETVTCTVTASDGKGGTGTATASSLITNTAPTVSVSIVESSAQTNDTLTAGVTASDSDGDTLTTSYDWMVGGVSVYTGGSTLDGSLFFDKDDSVTVEVTVDDGTDTASATSSALVIDNTAPTAPTLSITPSVAYAGDELVCIVDTDSDDDDGDTVNYSMSWTVDGIDYVLSTDSGDTGLSGTWVGPSTTTWDGDTVDGADVGRGEEWICTATPDDGDDEGDTATASRTVEDCSDGLSIVAAAESCEAIQACDASLTDGLYYLDPTGSGSPYETYCLMDSGYDSGGWTLVAVSSDDGQDTWTWTNRLYWTTDTTTFGTTSDLTQDFKSDAFHEVEMTEVLFVHEPSGVWVTYDLVSSATDFGAALASYGPGNNCYNSAGGRGIAMKAGTLTSASLCNTDLFIHPYDHDIGCVPSTSTKSKDDTYGPAWSDGGGGQGCPLDDPGQRSALGPIGAWDISAQNREGWTTINNPIGFGGATGRNTGTAGTGANHMKIYVR